MGCWGHCSAADMFWCCMTPYVFSRRGLHCWCVSGTVAAAAGCWGQCRLLPTLLQCCIKWWSPCLVGGWVSAVAARLVIVTGVRQHAARAMLSHTCQDNHTCRCMSPTCFHTCAASALCLAPVLLPHAMWQASAKRKACCVLDCNSYDQPKHYIQRTQHNRLHCEHPTFDIPVRVTAGRALLSLRSRHPPVTICVLPLIPCLPMPPSTHACCLLYSPPNRVLWLRLYCQLVLAQERGVRGVVSNERCCLLQLRQADQVLCCCLVTQTRVSWLLHHLADKATPPGATATEQGVIVASSASTSLMKQHWHPGLCLLQLRQAGPRPVLLRHAVSKLRFG